jgi:hypothetical protein
MKIIFSLLLITYIFVIHSQASTQEERWEGSVRGCLGGATPQERDLFGSKLPRYCTCLSNFLIKNCAPSNSTTNEQFTACAKKYNEAQIMGAINPCLKSGVEPLKNPHTK